MGAPMDLNAGVDAIETGNWSTVNAETGLSTDYLNHFNEAIMLLDMAGQMPDCFDELGDWSPISYVEHFEHSALKDRHKAIESYSACEAGTRHRFDEIVLNISTVLLDGISQLRHAIEDGHPERIADCASETTTLARQLVASAAAIVNGTAVNDGALHECEEEDPQKLADSLF